MKFSNYCESKNIVKTLDNLCQFMIESKIDFDEFWNKIGQPILLEQNKTPEQIVENWFSNLFNQQNNVKNFNFNGDIWGNKNKLDKEQGNLDKASADLKKRFADSMKIFLTNVQNDAKQTGNHYLWKTAEMLYTKLIDFVNNKYSPKVKYGDGSWKKNFNQIHQDYKNQQKPFDQKLPNALNQSWQQNRNLPNRLS